ncbi:hypothetical protein BU16DRAFT_57878 [Lophium mytilinum]|uniref:Uncharacterized protein n=1 Tax=Lophium mytilinum TaxID=390894 RepID=A0A6A6QNA4_9PEZI|nr:hypothetical protein BU16DRAFT_57878 [Lophium mytilinum]
MVQRRPHDACDTPTLTSMVADQTGIEQDAALVADRHPVALRTANPNSRRSCVLGVFLAAVDGQSVQNIVRQPPNGEAAAADAAWVWATRQHHSSRGPPAGEDDDRCSARSATLVAFPGQSPTRMLRAPSALGLATGKGDRNNAGGRHGTEAVGATLPASRAREATATSHTGKPPSRGCGEGEDECSRAGLKTGA